MKVRFSVLMPAYNREKYVGQAVDSVLSQDFTDYELFVIDDGSTDKTLQILESYGTRIKVLRQTNQGPEVARNKAAAQAQGEYLVLLDSDDLLLPCALATYDRIIQTFDSPPLIIGSMTDFQDGESIPVGLQASLPIKILKYRDYLSKDVKLRLSSSRIVLRRSVFDAVGGLRNTTAATFHLDSLNLILKVATYGPCVVVQQPCTVAYRHHETNAIRSLGPITDGILALARSEHQGQYPGGNMRRRDRYACIGGVALSWAVSHCLRGRCWKLAFRLLRDTTPMGLAAIRKKVLTSLRKPTQAIVLSEHKSLMVQECETPCTDQ
jgi:glycosyltransferase involved in cell wall biosynthesis